MCWRYRGELTVEIDRFVTKLWISIAHLFQSWQKQRILASVLSLPTAIAFVVSVLRFLVRRSLPIYFQQK
ncbi:MAG: hypothetical protein KME17_02795 [Cyanosarcina radialis HA8281-LM2]|nr:hypothetical protein [Cyanosarcina radialis HA8281-LM2]